MITLHSFSTFNRIAVPYATFVHSVDVMDLLKDGYGSVMVSERHRHRPIKLLGDRYIGVWATEPLCIRYAFRVDSRPILLPQEMKLSKIANGSTTNVR